MSLLSIAELHLSVLVITSIEGSKHAENHFNKLANLIRSVPSHNMITIMSNCNIHISKKIAPFTFHECINISDQFLIDLTLETNLITNTRFQKGKGKL